MTLKLDLPRELEAELAIGAAREGVSVEIYALRLLSGARAHRDSIQTGAQLVEYWNREGVIGTRTVIVDSQSHARAIRAAVERRERE
jgi:hypothetical protein